MRKLFHAVPAILSLLLLFACRKAGDDTVQVKSVSLIPSQTTLVIQESRQLRAVVKPANATEKTVEWSVDAPEVVSVSESGLITALSEGTATVSATAGGVGGVCLVRVIREIKPVIEVSSVSISPSPVTIVYGEQTTLSATVLPENATYPSVSWSSSDESVLTVDSNGVVKTVSAGTATVTAAASNGVKDECEVTVQAFPAFNVQRYNRRTGTWADAVSAGIYGFPGDSISVRIVVLRDDGPVTVSVVSAPQAVYSDGKLWLHAPGETVLKVVGQRGYVQEVPVHSNLSDTFECGSQAREYGATVIMGNNSDNTVALNYSDGAGVLRVPAWAYDLSFTPSGLISLNRGTDSWALRSGTGRGQGKVNVSLGTWVQKELCTLIVTDDFTSGDTEPVQEFDIDL